MACMGVRVRHAVAVPLAGLMLAVSSCGGAEQAEPVAAPPETAPSLEPEPAPAAPGCAARVSRLRSTSVAYGAVVVKRTTAVRRVGGRSVARFATRNVNGVPTVLGVVSVRRNAACEPTWYRVQLPIRPNGSVGWVRAADVRLRPVTTRILIDLSDRRVTVFRGGSKVLETRAAIGSPDTPTPTGRYYVNQRLRAADPSGPFGPGAVGISAFSPTLQQWTQGGPIAIHGTNAPYKLGLAVSHGCVRISNRDLLRVYALADEGTPVLIRS